MRVTFAALTLSLLLLAACGGGGGTSTLSSGSVAPPSSGTPTPTPTATPTPTPTSTPTPTPSTTAQANMFDVTAATSFDAVGSVQSLTIDKNGAQLYKGNASTVAAPTGQITYNPRDGIFTLALSDSQAGVTRNITFQDPAHRATADVARTGEYQVPLLAGFNYLQVLDGKVPLTFFYRRPGTNSSFVSIAGFERSEITDAGTYLGEQGVFVFGAKSTLAQVPTSGTGRYNGDFLATMTGTAGNSGTALQWINGTSAVDVDFAKRTLGLTLTGTVGPAYVKSVAVDPATLTIPQGATFTAQGSASWTGASAAFAGRMTSAGFTFGATTIPVDFTSVSAGTAVAGASSIDGTFYGPEAKNIGGNVRIVGGVPNQRVDILGAFTGAKQ